MTRRSSLRVSNDQVLSLPKVTRTCSIAAAQPVRFGDRQSEEIAGKLWWSRSNHSNGAASAEDCDLLACCKEFDEDYKHTL